MSRLIIGTGFEDGAVTCVDKLVFEITSSIKIQLHCIKLQGHEGQHYCTFNTGTQTGEMHWESNAIS